MQQDKKRSSPFAAIEAIGKSLVRLSATSRHRKAFVVGSLGLTLLIVPHAASVWMRLPETLVALFSEVGIACLIAAIAEFILLENAVAAIREAIQDETDLAKNCSKHQLIDVISPRTQEDSPALKLIERAINEAEGDVYILGLSLKDFLPDRYAPRGGLSALLNSKTKITVKMLLIDPICDALNVLAYAEQGESLVDHNELYTRVCNSAFRIRSLKTTDKDLPIEARFHNTLPSYFMVSTSGTLFVEPYHFGSIPGQEHRGYGTAPILQFSPHSAMYELARTHFSHIWNSQKSTINGANRGRGNVQPLQVRNLEQVLNDINRRSNRERRASRGRKSFAGTDKRVTAGRRADDQKTSYEPELLLGQRASTG